MSTFTTEWQKEWQQSGNTHLARGCNSGMSRTCLDLCPSQCHHPASYLGSLGQDLNSWLLDRREKRRIKLNIALISTNNLSNLSNSYIKLGWYIISLSYSSRDRHFSDAQKIIKYKGNLILLGAISKNGYWRVPTHFA